VLQIHEIPAARGAVQFTQLPETIPWPGISLQLNEFNSADQMFREGGPSYS